MSEMDDLAAFAVLIEAGSFTLAAEQLGCSKGQLSKRISQLEAQFSVVLLHRTTRKLSLTAAGAALLPRLRRWWTRWSAPVRRWRGSRTIWLAQCV